LTPRNIFIDLARKFVILKTLLKGVCKMKKLIEDENEGLLALIGETVTLFCLNYIYAGKLVGVNQTCVKLENAHIVYETGAFNDKKFKDAQKLPQSELYVQVGAIESFGILKSL
jgi:hypothetical protein